MSSTKLERAFDGVRSFIPYSDKEMRARLDMLEQAVAEQNVDNIEAHIPVTLRTLDSLHIGNMSWGEGGYEILSGERKDEWDREHRTKDEYEAHLEKFAMRKYRVRELWCADVDGESLETYFDSKAEVEAHLREEYDADDDTNVIKSEVYMVWLIEEADDSDLDEDDLSNDAYTEYEEYRTLDEASQKLDEFRADWVEEKLDGWDELDIEHDEFMWNYAWRYDDRDINTDMAERIGLGTLRITDDNHDDYNGEFFTILTIGMDMSPQFAAYEALEFGGLREESVKHFTSRSHRSYARSVMGYGLYREVMDKLGLMRWFDEDVLAEQEEAAERAAKRASNK